MEPYQAKTEILVTGSNKSNVNQSICSFHSLVSDGNDSILWVDDNDDFCSHDPEGSLVGDTLERKHFYHHHQSISTEMAIIATSSPEIKALTDQTVTQLFPHKINFDPYLPKLLDAESADCDTLEASTACKSLTLLSLTPVRTTKGENHQEMQASTDITSFNRQPSTTLFDDEADGLAKYLQQQNIAAEIRSPIPPTIGEPKENLSPTFGFHDKTPEISNQTRRENNLTFKSALRKETRRHRSLSFVAGCPEQRQLNTMHRRVSFDSLPSPAEIASLHALHSPATSKPTLNALAPPGKSPLAMDFPFY
ncbi:hypothetical protein IV203_016964 [Nitzschia inconspicua]|uniref:Uncharacterized protein n=1 Tax=Nitzschia inconspicua TaxID=303405 RepID=A0A9K3K6Y9_9STRA|nr:hypothetical protein IV203_017523 [Nitzschia inconspicua]KAG7348259.1 hypothetical protein IV203_016964 [Nitzschia inconspicua]